MVEYVRINRYQLIIIIAKRKKNGQKMGKSKENARNSSLELLRIICMLLIIAHHYSVHGGYGELTSASLSGGSIFIQILSLYGKLSCTIFILISAYFLVDAPEIRYKRIIPLVAEMFFYSFVIMIIMYSLKRIFHIDGNKL